MNFLTYFNQIIQIILRKFYLKRNSLVKRQNGNYFNLIIITLLISFLYTKYTHNKYYQDKSDSVRSKVCHVAFVTNFAKTSTLIDEFNNDLIYSLYHNNHFSNNCSFSIFVLIWSNMSWQFDQTKFKRWSIIKINLDHEPFSNNVKELAHRINHDGYTSVIINYKIKLFPFNWQLVDLARNLWNNIDSYFIIQKALSYPSVEELGAIRQMAKHSKYLISLSWFSYHTLMHAYGINESKLLYIPQGLPITNSKFKKNYELENILSKYNESDYVVLLGGLINVKKGFTTFIKLLPELFYEISNLKLLIAASDNSPNNKAKDILEKTNYLDSYMLSRITWIDKMISKNDIQTIQSKVNALLIIYDEITPSSSSILNLMKHGVPVFSTPSPFSIEMIGYQRGFLLPYQVDSIFIKTLTDYLRDKFMQNNYAIEAKNFVKNWDWSSVSNKYVFLFRNLSNNKIFTENERVKFNNHLSQGFKVTYHEYNSKTLAVWNNKQAFTFDAQNLYEILKKENAVDGIYAVYSDFNIQLNVKINHTYKIETVAVRVQDKFVIIDLKMGIEEFKIGKNSKDFIKIDYKTNKVVVETINVKFSVERTIDQVSIEFYGLNRFTHAYGLFGSTVRKRYDLLDQSEGLTSIDPKIWLIKNNDYFSHFAPGQIFSASGINSNSFILEENDLIINETSKMSMFIEGQFFMNSGFGGVNRKMYLELINYPQLNVFVRADKAELRSDEKSVEILLAYSLFLRQEKILRKKLKFYTMNNLTVSFRNSYPPKMRIASKNTIIIIQQPWEYHGMPRYWIPYFETTANEVWVPTHYCKNSLIANGLSPDKIHVISHGVYYEKFQLDLDKLTLPTKKKFKFLTVGGLLLRKGIDVLIKAYTSVFTRNDDVTLIIHCIYSLGYNDDYIKKVQENPNSPEIVFFQEPLSEIDMIRMSVDVYVSPYRSEGFGLTILEAMAAGLPPIVTHSGASLDFCPPEGVYFIEAHDVVCLEYPCGKMKAFQYPTVVQPMWAEPSVKSLAEKMNESYLYPDILKKKAQFVKEFARNYTWDNIIDQIVKRIFYLADRHVNYNF